VGYFITTAASECQVLCRNNAECNYFVWFEEDCYLLKACDDLFDCPCCISGPEYPDVANCDLGC